MTVRESEILAHLAAVAAAGEVTEDARYVLEGVAAQDDCAVLSPLDGHEICVTTDFVRGTGFHLFRTGHLKFYDLGWYVVAANVSDLAAMGADPVCYLSIVRYPPSRTKAELEQLLAGISDACGFFSIVLVGGDTGTYEVDVLAGTAVGYVRRGTRLSRATLRSGDALFVSGDIGRPAAALAAVLNGVAAAGPPANSASALLDRLLQRWRRPSPRVELGRMLASTGSVSACMDVSDGITASLQQLHRITGLGFRLNGAALPIDRSVVEMAAALGKDLFDLACGASVDFELLFAARVDAEDQLQEVAMKAGVPITRIGSVLDSGALLFERPDGSVDLKLPGVPWDHQHSDAQRLYDEKS